MAPENEEALYWLGRLRVSAMDNPEVEELFAASIGAEPTRRQTMIRCRLRHFHLLDREKREREVGRQEGRKAWQARKQARTD